MTTLLWNLTNETNKLLKYNGIYLVALVISPSWHLDGWKPKGPP